MNNPVIEKRKVELNEIGTMLRTIAQEHPFIETNKEYARIISETFDVECTEEDVNNYHELDLLHDYFVEEDYELEARRSEFKHYY